MLLGALDYRVTFLQAGAGFGKSTALNTVSGRHSPVIWYQVGDGDDDALVFLQHLCHATQLAIPKLDGLPLALLESWDLSSGGAITREIVFRYLNAIAASLDRHTLLVIDDVHRVSGNPEIVFILDQLVRHAPQQVHFLISSRLPVSLPSLEYWQGRGLVQHLSKSILAFTREEIARLFSEQYDFELTDDEVERVYQVTEGWAITLQLIWQNLRSGNLSILEGDLAGLQEYGRQDQSLDHLFRLLAQEVFFAQPKDIQEFLRASATLRTMTVPACNALLEARDSDEKLDYLRRQELFIVPVDEQTIRYHHIFHRFLRQQSNHHAQADWHTRAGAYFRRTDQADAAIYHFLKAENFEEAAEMLTDYGERLLSSGRFDTLTSYLDTLPPEHLAAQPLLQFYLGDLARLRNRFEEALGWYRQAEAIWRDRGQVDGAAKALRGQARIYLDTVNPARAEDLLQQALRLTDGTSDRESQARLYELLAENKLNAGKPAEAERFRQQAEAMRLEGPSDSQLPYRILLRTGRLSEARSLLSARLEAEREATVHTPRAHRETNFVLSLIHAFLGEADTALARAIEGTELGLQLESPYMTAVGHMRQGHARMLKGGRENYEMAREHFKRAVETSRELSVPRLRVEAHWGLCRAYGYEGDIRRALEQAQSGIEIAAQAGDEWVASLTRLAMGASLALAGRYEAAEEWLNRAAWGMDECADPYSAAAARIWLLVCAHKKGDEERVRATLPEFLAACKGRDEAFLLSRATLIGLPDPKMFVPLLLVARANGWEPVLVDQALNDLGLTRIRFHPGYQLRVYLFGKFRCELGAQMIPENGWRRQTTRQIWQLLINFRGEMLDKEQIFEYLWPGGDPEAAQRNFKVALNTLFKVLEPNRKPGAESAYIYRDGTQYGIRPEADIWIDADAFIDALNKSDELPQASRDEKIRAIEDALLLYAGEYLPDARYETWAASERELLSVQYLKASDRLTALYLDAGQVENALRSAQKILTMDNCWERAYRHLMIGYHRLGDIGQVGRAYQRCVDVLAKELDVSPSEETRNLYQQLTSKEHSTAA